MKITKKLQKFIEGISYVGESKIPKDDAKIYYSKVDGSYLTREGAEDSLNFLLKRGITEQIQNCNNEPKNTANIGFNPLEQKWYGWSHRAIYGFGVGSVCKQGNIGFQPKNKEEFIEDCLRFWGDLDMEGDTYKTNPTVREEFRDGKWGAYVEYRYNDKVPNESMRGEMSGMFSEYPSEWGKGEWTAITLEEAKEMAINFAKDIS